jgi:Protein of unknown function (DUF3365)
VFIRSTMLACLLAGCAAPPPEDTARLAAEARKVAAGMQQSLASKLLGELQANGPEAAIAVCTTLAPDVAARISREQGWRVTRVSLRTRNPVLGSPDAWEQAVLAEFDARAARGDKPDAIEHAEVVREPRGRYFRYMKALPVAPLCVTCHGGPESIPPGVKTRLAAAYPHDRATGYRPGELRGAISIKRPLD